MKHTSVILTAACLAGVFCAQVQASTILSFQPSPVLAMPGDTGDAFNVVLTNTGPGTISVAAFSFEVTVADASITFTGADFSTTPGYIFAGDSFDQINGFALNALITNPQVLDATDGTNDFTGVTLNPGNAFSLGRVLFNVSPTAAFGPIGLSFTGGSVVNALSDPSGLPINIDTLSDTDINIVPEPSSLLLMVAGLAFLARRAAK